MKLSSFVTILSLALAASAAPTPKGGKNNGNNNQAATPASAAAPIDPADPCLVAETAAPIDGKAPPGAVVGGTDPNAQIIDARAACNAQAAGSANANKGVANAGAADAATPASAAAPIDPADPCLTAETAAPIDGKAPPGAVVGGTDPNAQIIDARAACNANANKGAANAAKGKKGKGKKHHHHKGAAAAAGGAGGAAAAAGAAQNGAASSASAAAASPAAAADAAAVPAAAPIDPEDPGLTAETAAPIDGKAPPGAVVGGTDPNAQIIDARKRSALRAARRAAKKGKKHHHKGAAAAAGGAGGAAAAVAANGAASSASAAAGDAAAAASPVDAADPGLVAETAAPINGKAPPGAVAGGTDANAQIIDARQPKHHRKGKGKNGAAAAAASPAASAATPAASAAASAPAAADAAAAAAGPVDAADPGLVAETAAPINGKAPPGAVAGGTDANAQIIDARRFARYPKRN